jgi:hypothetical protein
LSRKEGLEVEETGRNPDRCHPLFYMASVFQVHYCVKLSYSLIKSIKSTLGGKLRVRSPPNPGRCLSHGNILIMQ